MWSGDKFVTCWCGGNKLLEFMEDKEGYVIQQNTIRDGGSTALLTAYTDCDVFAVYAQTVACIHLYVAREG